MDAVVGALGQVGTGFTFPRGPCGVLETSRKCPSVGASSPLTVTMAKVRKGLARSARFFFPMITAARVLRRSSFGPPFACARQQELEAHD